MKLLIYSFYLLKTDWNFCIKKTVLILFAEKYCRAVKRKKPAHKGQANFEAF